MFNYDFFFLNNCHYKTADAILNCYFLFWKVTHLQKHCFSGQKKGFPLFKNTIIAKMSIKQILTFTFTEKRWVIFKYFYSFLLVWVNVLNTGRTKFCHEISKKKMVVVLSKTTKTLVHAFVTSKVDYCNSLLYGVPKYLLQRLQRVLNYAARIVFKSNKYDHIMPLLGELQWLPIQRRIEFKILLITFKALNKQAPTYLTDLLISYTPSRSLRSSSKNLLKIPMYNLKSYGGRSFALASAVLWNSLP